MRKFARNHRAHRAVARQKRLLPCAALGDARPHLRRRLAHDAEPRRAKLVRGSIERKARYCNRGNAYAWINSFHADILPNTAPAEHTQSGTIGADETFGRPTIANCGSADCATPPLRAGRTRPTRRRALYHRPPIAWSIDKASDFHDFPDYAVEDKIVPDCYAIVWMFAIFLSLHRLKGFWCEQPICYRPLNIINKSRSRIRTPQFNRNVSDSL